MENFLVENLIENAYLNAKENRSYGMALAA